MSAKGLRCDVVVVGAGIIGLSVAFELSANGRKVVVVEKNRACRGATAAAGGMLAPSAESEVADERLVKLALESNALYPEFIARVEEVAGIDCGYRREGTLLLALDRDHRERLARAAAIERTLMPQTVDASPTLEWLDPVAVRRLEPKLSPRITGAFLARNDRQVDPSALCDALVTAIRKTGGEIFEETTIDERTAGGVELSRRNERMRVECETIVLANGVDPEPPYPGAPDLGLRPIKGQILCLYGEPLLEHVVRTPDVYLIPRRDGRLLLGVTSEDVGFDRRPTAGAAHDILREAFRALPGIVELEFKGIDIGFRPALRDRLPAVGWIDDPSCGSTPIPRQLVAQGHYRHGILLAPITAWMIARLVTGKSLPEAYDPFFPRSPK